jgi:rare lipoprotein A
VCAQQAYDTTASDSGQIVTPSDSGIVTQIETGNASFYGNKFHGRRTASGEKYNRFDYTCAHKYYPFGTRLRVTCIKNGKWVVVRVNDRGPHVRTRKIDLSMAAAKQIGMVAYGITKVKIERLK